MFALMQPQTAKMPLLLQSVNSVRVLHNCLNLLSVTICINLRGWYTWPWYVWIGCTGYNSSDSNSAPEEEWPRIQGCMCAVPYVKGRSGTFAAAGLRSGRGLP